MTVDAKDLPRSFAPSTNAGSCGICQDDFEKGQGSAFYATVRRDSHGDPIWTGEAQVAPKDARTPVRPQGCTCRGRSAHTARCALWVENCPCPTGRSRAGRTYTKHRRSCGNSISFADRFATLPGFRDVAVHCQCAADRGLTVPAEAKVAYGRRVEGHFNTGGVGVTAQPAPTATEVAAAVNRNELATVAGRGVANAVAEADEAREALEAARRATRERQAANRGWMESMARDSRAEREASIRARAEAAEAAQAEREAKAQREREEAKAARQSGSGRFAVLDLDDDGERELESRALTSGEERFAALDLD